MRGDELESYRDCLCAFYNNRSLLQLQSAQKNNGSKQQAPQTGVRSNEKWEHEQSFVACSTLIAAVDWLRRVERLALIGNYQNQSMQLPRDLIRTLQLSTWARHWSIR